MQNERHIRVKDAVLVPLKDWEKMQRELERLRKRAAKDELLIDLSTAIAGIRADLNLPPNRRKKRKSADEFLQEMRDA